VHKEIYLGDFTSCAADPKHSPRPAKQWSSKSHEEYLSTPAIEKK